MAASKDVDWEDVIETTYDVVEDQLGRGRAFERILARTIGVAGLYEVYILAMRVTDLAKIQNFL